MPNFHGKFMSPGIDTVITQMLNQMDNAGPPPLSKEKIESVERTEISDEQVEQNLQCSVCWENFEKLEKVRKLPCTVSSNTCIWQYHFSGQLAVLSDAASRRI